MGAANVLAAYRLYGGKVPPAAMNVLAYMACRALDKDDPPKFWLGHEDIAVSCLGRPKPNEADLRAVRRAITPLVTAGAITTDRHGSATRGVIITARYRLWLTSPAPDEIRPMRGASEPIEDTGRKASYAGGVHRTKSDRAPDEIRPPQRTRRKNTKEEKTPPPRRGRAAARPPDRGLLAENMIKELNADPDEACLINQLIVERDGHPRMVENTIRKHRSDAELAAAQAAESRARRAAHLAAHPEDDPWRES